MLNRENEVLPDIIIHNSISLDGSLVDFEVNMGLHYQIAGQYSADAHLIGSNTIKVGVEMYGELPPEEKSDFTKPERDKALPYWVIIDTKGICRGLLHACRKFEYCRDVVVLISKSTPQEYIVYLTERNYDYHVMGQVQVNLPEALALLADDYAVKTILTDTGSTLGGVLLNQGLVKEISLLVHPVIVGQKAHYIFRNVSSHVKLKKEKCEALDDGYLWLVYQVVK